MGLAGRGSCSPLSSVVLGDVGGVGRCHGAKGVGASRSSPTKSSNDGGVGMGAAMGMGEYGSPSISSNLMSPSSRLGGSKAEQRIKVEFIVDVEFSAFVTFQSLGFMAESLVSIKCSSLLATSVDLFV